MKSRVQVEALDLNESRYTVNHSKTAEQIKNVHLVPDEIVDL